MTSAALPSLASATTPRMSRWKWGWIAFGLWTFLVAASVAQIALVLAQRGQPVHLIGLVVGRALDWYTCALFTPVFVWLVYRFPLSVASWRHALPWYLLVTSVCVVLKYVIMFGILRLTIDSNEITLGRLIAQNFLIEFVIFAGVIAVIHALALQQRLAQREQLALELRAQLSEAELAMLKGQLQPHFLFNTLNGVASLIHTAPATADFIIVQLADLLRASLGHEGTREITLAEELALLDKYLAIMEARFLGHITIERDIDAATSTALVPQFLLQPLVENAFEHGIGRRASSGRIRIRAAIVEASRLRLEVSDDGAGISHDAAVEERVGLGNTRQRLTRLYGKAHSLVLESLADGGARVTVEFPLRTT